jgi:7,8-dihydropterin-6-yl-methyl-4-(beta-D-ribofuranosyl)aminobenzene 5'-phosphate synthase
MSRRLLFLTLLVVCVLAWPVVSVAQTPRPVSETPAGTVVTGTGTAQSLALPPKSPGDVRLTILYDNLTPVDPRLKADWGFAALLEYGSHVLLFDTGANGSTLLPNMKQLGVDPRSIEAVILSHSDGDHIDGLQALLDTGAKPTVYVLSSFMSHFTDRVRAQTRVVEVTDPVEVVPGVHTTRMVDRREEALVVKTRDGTLVVTGCAHPGVVKMVQAAQEVAPGKVVLLAGGFHLSGYLQSQLTPIVAQLRQLGVQGILACHCTGDEAMTLFRTKYGPNYMDGGVGRTVTLPMSGGD